MKVRTRKLVALGLIMLSASIAVWATFQDLPVLVLTPAPATNVLGDDIEKPIIEVSGIPDEETYGALDLLSVSEYGSPNGMPDFWFVAKHLFSADSAILPMEVFYPIGVDPATIQAEDAKDMADSQEAAIALTLSKVPEEIRKKVRVKLHLTDVGGPSGGLIFALGIYEKLTPGSLIQGKAISGTGTIDASGKVGPIGGVVQKAYGSLRAGDKFMLVPEENCEELSGYGSLGVKFIRVKTFDDALAAVRVIANDGDISKLPVCNAY